jgi:hypothetical protein
MNRGTEDEFIILEEGQSFDDNSALQAANLESLVRIEPVLFVCVFAEWKC